MDDSMKHEDLLIKLRAKLNEEKIKLWEPPFVQTDGAVPQSLQDLAHKYSSQLSETTEAVLGALVELQTHSVERCRANQEFKETGTATLRVKVVLPGAKAKNLSIQKKLNILGSELIEAVATEINVDQSRVKLIVNGKVVKPQPTIAEQGIQNGAQVMALVLAETPEAIKEEDNMYLEMKATRDDATLLSECVDDVDDDDEYMKLEDQSGQAVQLPAAERRALLVGLALHARGRAALAAAAPQRALPLLLEADRLFSECRSSLLARVDNWPLLQLDIAWCYVKLRATHATHAGDAARRLAAARDALTRTYAAGGGTSRYIRL
ncbi:unnamed protein product [Plutella xylostella]|uniref:(diamondback moth) hypothetical protein n=1 Tax=Plutella xylostella TaxID=51655 RepID=A0A8S4FJG2_PLUXY|nr:unnamed protein product [Plutella xylostella]